MFCIFIHTIIWRFFLFFPLIHKKMKKNAQKFITKVTIIYNHSVIVFFPNLILFSLKLQS